MPIVSGVIKAVSVKERETQWGTKMATSFNIDDVWYSGGFKKYQINKGDEVELNYETTDKGFNNIKAINVTKANPAGGATQSQGTGGGGGSRQYRKNGEEGGFPVHPLAYERALDRRNALQCAVKAMEFIDYSTEEEDVTEIILTNARKFEAYTTGDLDRDEALAMMDKEG